MERIINALRNRKKLILGLVAYAAIYAFNRLVLNADDTQVHGTALAGAAIAVERAGPIFGIAVDGPKVTERGEVVIEVKETGSTRKEEVAVAPAASLKK